MGYVTRLAELTERSVLVEGRSSPRTGLTGRGPTSVLMLLAQLSTAPERMAVDMAAQQMFSKFKLSKKVLAAVMKSSKKERETQGQMRASMMGGGGAY